MANTKSAQKMVGKIAKRTSVNKARWSRIRTQIRKVEEWVVKGNKKQATEALRLAQPEIMRGAQKGLIHARTATRKVSRLAKRVANIS